MFFIWEYDKFPTQRAFNNLIWVNISKYITFQSSAVFKMREFANQRKQA